MGLDQNASNRLKGPRVFLRPLTEEDVGPDYVRWMNDPEVVRYLVTPAQTRTREALVGYVRQQAANPDVYFWAVCMNDTGRHVGNLKLGPVEHDHSLADMGVVIGETEFWGQGLASEAIALGRDFAFQVLGLDLITAGFYLPNIGSQKAFEKCGFVVDRMEKNHRVIDGRPRDAVFLACDNPNKS